MVRKKYTHKCKFCSREFNPFRRSQIYCSKSCRAKDVGVGRGVKTGKFVKCSICGKEIWRKGYQLKKFGRFFCSRKCLGIANGIRLKNTKRDNHWMVGDKNWAWKGGLPKCKYCGKELSAYHVDKCRECYFKDLEPTSIEKILYEELESMGVLFEEQKLINGRFIVDAYIPNLNLIIEADGDYWHSLEDTKKLDKAKNAYLLKCGFNLLRLSEDEINNGKFKEIIGQNI